MSKFEMRAVPGTGNALRCELCNDVIGEWFGDEPPNPDLVVLRCYACAAVEEAEKITAEG